MYLESAELSQIVNSVYRFWDSGIDRQWFELIKRGLNKSGLLYYEDEDSKKNAILNVIASAVIYNEACYRLALHGNNHFSSLDQSVADDIERDIEIFDKAYINVSQALSAFFGNERELTKEFYINAKQGALSYGLRLDEKTSLKSDVENLLYRDDPSVTRLYTYFCDTKSAVYLEGMSIKSTTCQSNNI